MARDEQDREDLMHEATALERRVELQLPDLGEPGGARTCVVGFRRTGEASIYVEAEPVFQFNIRCELRRGFWNGRLVKAEGGRLVQLDRRRTDDEIQLVRHELTDSQTAEFMQFAEETLDLLRLGFREGKIAVVKRVPAHLDAAELLTSWLDSLPRPLRIASVPNVAS